MVQPAGARVTGVTGGSNLFERQVWVRRVGTGEQQMERWVTKPKAGLAASSLSVAYSGTPEGIEINAASYPGIEAWGNINVASGNGANPSIALPLVLDPSPRDPNAWILVSIGDWTNTGWTADAGNNRKEDGASAATDLHAALYDDVRDANGALSIAFTKGANEWVAVASEAWGIPMPTVIDYSTFPKPITGQAPI
jgi:hypothetical protein